MTSFGAHKPLYFVNGSSSSVPASSVRGSRRAPLELSRTPSPATVLPVVKSPSPPPASAVRYRPDSSPIAGRTPPPKSPPPLTAMGRMAPLSLDATSRRERTTPTSTPKPIPEEPTSVSLRPTPTSTPKPIQEEKQAHEVTSRPAVIADSRKKVQPAEVRSPPPHSSLSRTATETTPITSPTHVTATASVGPTPSPARAARSPTRSVLFRDLPSVSRTPSMSPRSAADFNDQSTALAHIPSSSPRVTSPTNKATPPASKQMPRAHTPVAAQPSSTSHNQLRVEPATSPKTPDSHLFLTPQVRKPARSSRDAHSSSSGQASRSQSAKHARPRSRTRGGGAGGGGPPLCVEINLTSAAMESYQLAQTTTHAMPQEQNVSYHFITTLPPPTSSAQPSPDAYAPLSPGLDDTQLDRTRVASPTRQMDARRSEPVTPLSFDMAHPSPPSSVLPDAMTPFSFLTTHSSSVHLPASYHLAVSELVHLLQGRDTLESSALLQTPSWYRPNWIYHVQGGAASAATPLPDGTEDSHTPDANELAWMHLSQFYHELQRSVVERHVASQIAGGGVSDRLVDSSSSVKRAPSVSRELAAAAAAAEAAALQAETDRQVVLARVAAEASAQRTRDAEAHAAALAKEHAARRASEQAAAEFERRLIALQAEQQEEEVRRMEERSRVESKRQRTNPRLNQAPASSSSSGTSEFKLRHPVSGDDITTSGSTLLSLTHIIPPPDGSIETPRASNASRATVVDPNLQWRVGPSSPPDTARLAVLDRSMDQDVASFISSLDDASTPRSLPPFVSTLPPPSDAHSPDRSRANSHARLNRLVEEFAAHDLDDDTRAALTNHDGDDGDGDDHRDHDDNEESETSFAKHDEVKDILETAQELQQPHTPTATVEPNTPPPMDEPMPTSSVSTPPPAEFEPAIDAEVGAEVDVDVADDLSDSAFSDDLSFPTPPFPGSPEMSAALLGEHEDTVAALAPLDSPHESHAMSTDVLFAGELSAIAEETNSNVASRRVSVSKARMPSSPLHASAAAEILAEVNVVRAGEAASVHEATTSESDPSHPPPTGRLALDRIPSIESVDTTAPSSPNPLDSFDTASALDDSLFVSGPVDPDARPNAASSASATSPKSLSRAEIEAYLRSEELTSTSPPPPPVASQSNFASPVSSGARSVASTSLSVDEIHQMLLEEESAARQETPKTKTKDTSDRVEPAPASSIVRAKSASPAPTTTTISPPPPLSRARSTSNAISRFDPTSAAHSKRLATLAAFSSLRDRAGTLIKHGRRGRPHRSVIKLFEGAIYWNFEEWKKDAPSSKVIPLLTVSAVLAGRRTADLRRSASAAEEDLCFAVISPSRELSLQVIGTKDDRDLWVAGLTIAIETWRHEQQFWDTDKAMDK